MFVWLVNRFALDVAELRYECSDVITVWIEFLTLIVRVEDAKVGLWICACVTNGQVQRVSLGFSNTRDLEAIKSITTLATHPQSYSIANPQSLSLGHHQSDFY